MLSCIHLEVGNLINKKTKKQVLFLFFCYFVWYWFSTVRSLICGEHTARGADPKTTFMKPSLKLKNKVYFKDC